MAGSAIPTPGLRCWLKGDADYESINNGNPYPSNFDRPHVLNVVANYSINRRFSVGSNLVYMSGRPVTYPTSLYYINNVAYIDYYATEPVQDSGLFQDRPFPEY